MANVSIDLNADVGEGLDAADAIAPPITWAVDLRLEGEALPDVADIDLVSMPMLPGVIQVPAGGQPIVLMPDAPTVGGYPVSAVVIEAERGRTGQLRPGDELHFSFVNMAEARRRRAVYLELLRDGEAALA
jgi:allophanate hydrolase subunit 2